MELYKQDDLLTWEDWLKTHPRPPGATDLPWGAKSVEEQDLLNKWKAGYYNAILSNGGYVSTEAVAGNPYVHVYDGSKMAYVSQEEGVKSREHMGIDQRAQEPSTTKATAMGISNPAPASFWNRLLEWIRRLFGK